MKTKTYLKIRILHYLMKIRTTKGGYDTICSNMNVLSSTPDERPLLLKDHVSGSKGVAPQEGFHCYSYKSILLKILKYGKYTFLKKVVHSTKMYYLKYHLNTYFP